MTNSDIVHALKRIDLLLLEIKDISVCPRIDELCVKAVAEIGELADKLVDGLAAEVDPMM